jgi:hypothetical protein
VANTSEVAGSEATSRVSYLKPNRAMPSAETTPPTVKNGSLLSANRNSSELPAPTV